MIELTEADDGRVRVDMGAPVFALDQVPFDPTGLTPVPAGATPDHLWQLWLLDLKPNQATAPASQAQEAMVNVAILSMGNPHAVQLVGDVDTAPVLDHGPLIERHPAFPNRVNAGFLQIVDRGHVRLRVYERGVGETLACGSGACAAAAVLMRRGRVDREVAIVLPGGELRIRWPSDDAPVIMSGPAAFVFEGEWKQ